MADLWVAEPRKAPHQCRRSGRASVADGPYFEDSLPYCEAPGDDRELTNYISLGWLRAITEAPGSPVVLMEREVEQELQRKLADLTAERDDLARQLAEATAPAPSPIDEEALASALIIRLDDRYARRAGRKPSPKAAA